jgi:phosphopantetheinyl transferase
VTSVYLFVNKYQYNLEILQQLKIHAHHYLNIDKRFTSYTGWWYLYNILLKDYKINLLEQDITYERNKPYINGIYFNISNSAELIAIVISDQECSIDIEYVDYKRNIDLISQRLFNEVLNNELFYQKWTIFEANIKYHSRESKTTFTWKEHYQQSSYYLTLCYNGKKPRLHHDF